MHRQEFGEEEQRSKQQQKAVIFMSWSVYSEQKQTSMRQQEYMTVQQQFGQQKMAVTLRSWNACAEQELWFRHKCGSHE